MRATVTVCVVLLGCGLAWAGEGQIQIGPTGPFPIVINQPGSYLLTADLVVPPSTNGIEIQANDVTLDLGGHSITGPGTSGGNGVYATGRTGVTVRNGTVASFGNGIDLEAGTSASYVVERVHAVACYDGISAYLAVISNCSAVGNSNYGVAGNFLLITSTQASNNAGGGVWIDEGSCTSCDSSANGSAGFTLQSSMCSSCTATLNGTYGFDISWGGNLLTSCLTINNTTAGLSGSCTSSNNACFTSNFN